METRIGSKSPLFILFSIGLAVFWATQTAYAITGFDPTLYDSTWSQSSSGASVTGGNVYNATVSTNEQTYRWAALWGNISGQIVLNNEDGNAVISWVISQIQDASVVYATTYDGTLDPTNFASFNRLQLNNTDKAYGYDPFVTDSISNTFTNYANFQSPSMDNPVVANTTVLESVWTNYVFRLNSSDVPASYPGGQDYVVWAVGVQNDQNSFYGVTADYELLIPENEEVGQGEGSPTTYYFWLEFN